MKKHLLSLVTIFSLTGSLLLAQVPMPLPKGYQRLGQFPLDATSVFTNLTELEDYAQNNASAYAGQLLALTDSNTNSIVYVVNTDKTITEIGTGGGNSITTEKIDIKDSLVLRGIEYTSLPLATTIETATLGISIDGNGAEITSGTKGYSVIPFDGVISEITGITDTDNGYLLLDLWYCTYEVYPEYSISNSICNGDFVEFNSGASIKVHKTNFNSWSKTVLSKNNILIYNIVSCTNITKSDIKITIKRDSVKHYSNDLQFQPLFGTNYHFTAADFDLVHAVATNPLPLNISHLINTNPNVKAISVDITCRDSVAGKHFCVCPTKTNIYIRASMITLGENITSVGGGVIPVFSTNIWYYTSLNPDSTDLAAQLTINGYWYNVYDYYLNKRFYIKYDNYYVVYDTSNPTIMLARDLVFNPSGLGENYTTTVSRVNSMSYAGFSDWRLPNLNEIETIRLETEHPFLPKDKPSLAQYSVPYIMKWVSEIDENNASAINLETGNVDIYNKTNLFGVLPVRDI